LKNLLGQRAIPDINFHRPVSLKHALQIVDDYREKAKLIAGGTDLIPAIRRGKISLREEEHLIDISSLEELRYILQDGNTLKIGAGCRLVDIEESELIRSYAPLLIDAVKQIGSLQIRNQGTIGGNLCNASPAADTAPALLTLDAAVEVRSIKDEYVIPLQELFVEPGKTKLSPNDVLVEIQVPIKQGAKLRSFLKLGRRNAFTLSVVAVAVGIELKKGVATDARIALGAVAPTPLRVAKAEGRLVGNKLTEQVIEEACKIVVDNIKPISDVRASEEYRRDMSSVLTRRAIQLCLAS
jgi:CO/xanthine dehydrogenase FAD-binding subunit